MLKISVKIQEALQDVNILAIIGSTDGKEEMKIALRDYFKANIHFGIFYNYQYYSTLKDVFLKIVICC